jgi:enoyl-[acyl-carrier-protein] reductase (NADH)
MHVVLDANGRIKEIKRNSPYVKLLNQQPNPLMTGFDLKYKLITQLENVTTAMCYVKWGGEKGITPIMMLPIPFSSFEILPIDTGGYAVQFTDDEGIQRTLLIEDVVILRKFFNQYDVAGDGNDALTDSLTMIKAANESLLDAVSISNKVRGLLKQRKAMLDSDDVKKSTDEFAARFAHAAEHGGIVGSREEDTDALLAAMHERHDAVEVFISNVSVALVIDDLEDYSKRSLFKGIEYSAWPMHGYTRKIKEVFGSYPRYVVGLSSGGPDYFYKNYDFVAASKALMETLCRYMNYRLFNEDVRINVVRSRLVPTESLRATFGRDFEDFADRFNMRHQFISCEEVANAILALCSGLMDGVSGQVLMVDRGTTFCDNLMRLYNERDRLHVDMNALIEKELTNE